MSIFRYSSKIILPKVVLFPQKSVKNRKGSSKGFMINNQNQKEELPMNAVIPYYNLNPKQKKIIISANQKLYKKASKKEKTLILNDLQIITGYSFGKIIFEE